MAGGGASSVVMLRLNFMTAIYLPILLYAMSTYELERGTLTISEADLEAVAVPAETSVFQGDRFSAQIFYRPVTRRQMGVSEDVETLARPRIVIDDAPPGFEWDENAREFIFDTEEVFAGEPQDVYEKQLSFRGTAILRSIVDDDREIPKPFEQTFTVRRPFVQVISNAPPRLVQDSRNDLSFNVMGLTDSEIVLRESSRGIVREGSSRLEWTPVGDTTVVSIFRKTSDGREQLVGTEGFQVVPPPPPNIGIREANSTSPLELDRRINPFATELEIFVAPDRFYFESFPDDANYRIREFELTFALPGQAATSTIVSIPRNESRSRQLGQAVYGPFRIGDLHNRYTQAVASATIRIRDVERINFENRAIPVQDGFANQFTLTTR